MNGDGTSGSGASGGIVSGDGVRRRISLHLSGAVQGVGFRPFVFRLARGLGVTGWITNDTAGVTIEAEAGSAVLEAFVRAVVQEAPAKALIQGQSLRELAPLGSAEFRIVHSSGDGARTAVVLPDLATCDDCVAEVLDRADRRAGYAFTNCTACGPRFSIVRDLPYDRASTTMAAFALCDECAAEYADPLDRRFHAQPNACPRCGPRLELRDGTGGRVACDGPLAAAAAALRGGSILAVKGIGGFHLMVDARNERAVAELRRRKRRPRRPLAVMAATPATIRAFATLDGAAEALLRSPAAPIVLVPRRPDREGGSDGRLASGIAPGNPFIGVMLPAMPLHHLLLRAFGGPLVATSGNLTDEPICTDEEEAGVRLRGIADLFLVHDRPIQRHVDDSVACFMDGAPRLLRRARGYAPLPLLLPKPLPAVLAVGPHLKNTIALARGRQVFLSQHIGDLETPEAQRAFERVAADFLRLYAVRPELIARDLHPDYFSTRWAVAAAQRLGIPDVAVQHHHAHLAACMAENDVAETTLGITWDGTGHGTDGTTWGGEFLLGDAAGFHRVAHLLPFRLPGGDAAVREPVRSAAALLHAALAPHEFADAVEPLIAGFSPAQRRVLMHMLGTGLHAPVTSSAGRLLDGIAALLGICTSASWEGEPAIRLEHAVDPGERGAYSIRLLPADGPAGAAALDWRPMLRDVRRDAGRGVATGTIAARVHNALVEALVLQAELAGCDRVALTGGCFQNRWLAERGAAALRRRGFRVLLHSRVPPGDGGIALGQVVVAAALAERGALPTALAADAPAASGVEG